MKLYISADIEGTTGICNWIETEKGNAEYDRMACQMTKEVAAVCEGANQAGVTQILIKDAHDSARNINPESLPRNTQIIRGWARNPFGMMAGLDDSFDAVAMTGYHTTAGTDGNPLAHIWDLQNEYIKLNGEYLSEFQMNAYIAAYFHVPVVLVSGDKMLCDSARQLIPSITTVPVIEGIGNATKSIHPMEALLLLENGIKTAFSGDYHSCIPELPKQFHMEIRFREHYRAYRSSFYPGAKQSDGKSVTFEADDYMDVLRFILFVL